MPVHMPVHDNLKPTGKSAAGDAKSAPAETYPWIKDRMSNKDVNGAIDAAMHERGMDPSSNADNIKFVSHANQMAANKGHTDRSIAYVNNETNETFPPPRTLERMFGLRNAATGGKPNHDKRVTNIDRGYLHNPKSRSAR